MSEIKYFVQYSWKACNCVPRYRFFMFLLDYHDSILVLPTICHLTAFWCASYLWKVVWDVHYIWWWKNAFLIYFLQLYKEFPMSFFCWEEAKFSFFWEESGMQFLLENKQNTVYCGWNMLQMAGMATFCALLFVPCFKLHWILVLCTFLFPWDLLLVKEFQFFFCASYMIFNWFWFFF